MKQLEASPAHQEDITTDINQHVIEDVENTYAAQRDDD